MHSLRTGSIERGGQKVDVGLLLGVNLLKTPAHPTWETRVDEALFRVLVESLSVIRGLEVFESKSKVEDVGS